MLARFRSIGRRLAPRRGRWWEIPVFIVVAVLLAASVRIFLVQPFFIPSPSMERTLHGCDGCAGDRILVNKLIYRFRSPHPGDIVVFHKPDDWPDDEPVQHHSGNPIVEAVRAIGEFVGFVPPDGEILVKRVIATGGDTVQGTTTDDGRTERVTVTTPDGHAHVLTEPYVFIDGQDPAAAFGPVTVPKGRLWVMGDHRSDSADSRFHCAANAISSAAPLLAHCDPTTSTVAVSSVVGKATVIAWPPSRWRTLGEPSTFKGLAALDLFLPLTAVAARRRRRRRPPPNAPGDDSSLA